MLRQHKLNSSHLTNSKQPSKIQIKRTLQKPLKGRPRTAKRSQFSTLTHPQSQSPPTNFHTPERQAYPTGEFQSTNELRSSFLNYFKSQGHEHLPSASVVPLTDPTLLFTSAGMVPFKNVFLGIEQPPRGKTRVTTSQRCVRAGGKHNDLDNVGYTARHHTYFEMLGNFSFGDYFKEEAIYYAWEYLTKTLKLPQGKLMVSVFETDDEAAQLWAKISGFSEQKGNIRRMGAADNFWQMGDTGPCGPCSEIYFDQGVEVDGEQFLEIWNLVFMQYNRLENGDLLSLEKKCVDTGMGLERLAAVMQGVRNNYDNDTFLSLINRVGSTAHFHNLYHLDQPSSSPIQASPNESSSSSSSSTSRITHQQRLTATRVITDHLRAVITMLYDGVQPANSGRGYVLRRILRRACRYGLTLGYSQPFMYQHVEEVVKAMEGAIPGLSAHAKQLRADLFREEKLFSSSLNKGMKIIKDYMLKQGVKIDDAIVVDHSKVEEADKAAFPVDLAFQLYDAHGFPIDLTELCIKDYGYKLDTGAVEQLLLKRKLESRETFQGNKPGLTNTTQLTQKHIDSIFDLWRGEGLTSEFVGYEKTFVENTAILDIIPLNDRVPIHNDHGEIVQGKFKRHIVLSIEECPFYPTGGGQTSDTGQITIRIPKPAFKKELQENITGDFETINVVVNNAIRDPSGQMILLVAEFEESDSVPSDVIIDMIKNFDPTRQQQQEREREQEQNTPYWSRIYASASVDSDLRSQTSIHHTTTHLLQAALQRVLKQSISEVGDHHHHLEQQSNHQHDDDTHDHTEPSIKQAGSNVHHSNLRFDFGFSRPLTQDEINSVEDRVNAIALRRIPVNISEMSFDAARKLGAMALFGEKYGSEVRVVSIPETTHSILPPIPRDSSIFQQNPEGEISNPNPIRAINRPNTFSIELCGGTHVRNTSECYPFVILAENGVSSGTRRIEAVAGPMAAQHLFEQQRIMKLAKRDDLLKVHHLADAAEVLANVAKLKQKQDVLQTRVKELEKEKLALMMGKGNGSNAGPEHLQDTDPFLATFWHKPAGCEFELMNSDVSQSGHAPLVLYYRVDASISGDYSLYRKFSEEIVQKQSQKLDTFMSKSNNALHQSALHVFVGAENGKSMIYSNAPEVKKTKGKEAPPILTTHGGKPVGAIDLWKSITETCTSSKGGGNGMLSQGTFDFTVIKSSNPTIVQDLPLPSSRTSGLRALISPFITQCMNGKS